MIKIDGSEGEGGGQVARNACALSLATGEAYRLTNVRAGRDKPGLMRQHVTAIEAACAISGSRCEGLAVGAREIEFHPGAVTPGDYHFAVGTAGSVNLVLQTVLAPLALAAAPSRVVIEGGTHNMLAPPFEFIERCFLPVFERMGPKVSARLVRHGFYPRGGGRIEVEITPAPLRRIECLARGALQARLAQAVFAALPFNIAKRMIDAAGAELADWPQDAWSWRELPQDQGPGVILLLEARYEGVTEIVSGFGAHGVPAERIAEKAAARLAGYMEGSAFAGRYLADQLILPFALAGGGAFTTVRPTRHTLTAIDVAARFLGRVMKIEPQGDGTHLVVG